MGEFRMEIRKYDGSLHRAYSALRLGRDSYGTWLGIPTGTVGDNGKVYVIPGVVLVPHVGWWTAMFNDLAHKTAIYCDITTPAVWSPRKVVVTDLDLDVRKLRHTGEVQLVDQDEFDVHRAELGYPDEVVQQAHASAKWLIDAVEAAVEPFGSHFHRWLDQVAVGKPPHAA